MYLLYFIVVIFNHIFNIILKNNDIVKRYKDIMKAKIGSKA